jgi:hypothetical protein
VNVASTLVSQRFRIIVVAIIAVALGFLWKSMLTGEVQQVDAGANLRAAINLERHGVISDSETAPFLPSMEREPLPAVVGAVALRIVDAELGAADPSAYFAGERVRLLKYQNVFWWMLLSGAVFAAARLLALSFYRSLLCVLLCNLLLLNWGVRVYMLDSLYTEAPAAALLTLGSVLLSAGLTRSRLVLVGLAGLIFGLLALVKAVFLYVTVGVAAAAAVLALLQHRSAMVTVRQCGLLCAAFAIAVGPWLLRNYSTFSVLGISGRGGETLYIRGTMDRLMTMDEYVGGYYYWAPFPLNAALRRILGYSRDDATRVGGRLQRLNESSGSEFAATDLAALYAGRPQDAINYYMRGAAEHVRLIQELKSSGDAEPIVHSDSLFKARGIKLVLAHPWKHAALTPLFLWRGAFFTFPFLAATFAWSLRRGKLPLALLTLPALGMILFYALVSFFELRYSLPVQPLALCAAVALCDPLLDSVKLGLSRTVRMVGGHSQQRPPGDSAPGVGRAH